MGKVNPWGECDLSSTRVRHKDMKRTWRNTLVRPELWDPKPKILDLQAPPPEKLYVQNPRPQLPAVGANLTAEDVLRQYQQQNSQ